MNLPAKISRFLKDESGPTAVEYAIMLAMIILATVVSVRALGAATNGAFSEAAEQIDGFSQ